jgi:MFS family permease
MAARDKSQTIDLNVAGRIALLFSGVLSSYAQGGLNSIMPTMAQHFAQVPGADFLSRLTVSIIGVMIAVGSGLFGAVADTYGHRRVLLLAMLTYGIVGCAPFFLDNIYLIVATRIVVGIAVAAAGAVMLAIVVTHTTGTARNKWFGYANTVGVATTLILIPIAGFVGNRGWQRPFLIHAIALPLAVLAYFGLEPDAPVNRNAKMKLRAAHGLPVRFLLFTCLTGILTATPLLYVPFRMRDIGIGDPGHISLIFLPLMTLVALSAYFYGTVRTRLSVTSTFAIGFGCVATALALDLLAASLPLLMVAQAVMGCGVGLASTNVYALAGTLGDETHKARIMGLTKGSLFAGPLVGQIALEPVVKSTSAGTALWLMCLLAITCATVQLWRMRERNPLSA